MPFVPHTSEDIAKMLERIGVDSIEALFDEIPPLLRTGELHLPDGITEQAAMRLMQTRANQDNPLLSFIGAGAYEHFIPAAVWDVTHRGEFMTAYTPYQAEASQGTLQLIYEYQTMISNLTGMEVSNASLYDGASSLAEAVLMAARITGGKSKRVLIPKTVHPAHRQTVKTIVSPQGIEIQELPFDFSSGAVPLSCLHSIENDFFACVIPQPNFFGLLEDVHVWTDWVQAKGALAIAVVNPLSLAVLEAPGKWGNAGVDIVCGEGQPLGIPLASGGPYFGFLTTQLKYVRQMPGRLIGRTLDKNGNECFTLTLQAREQHIRRAKATSNICTNQGLLVTAATIFMSLMGEKGLKKVALASIHNTKALVEAITRIPGIVPLFEGAYFHECAVRLPCSVQKVLDALLQENILGGYCLEETYPELENALLICATETKTSEDLARFTNVLERVIRKLR